MFTDRQNSILKSLLQRPDEYVKGQELAHSMGVSTKTVQQDIKYLKYGLSQYGATIEAVTNKGYRLRVADAEQYDGLLRMLEQQDKPEEEDKIYAREIVGRLLTHDGYIRIQELAEQMYVSESKLSKSLKDVRKLLEEFDLHIEHKPYRGIRISGMEEDIRRLIVLEGIPVYGVFEASEERIQLTNTLADIIIQTLTDERYLMSDVVLENLVLHTYIAIERVRDNHFVSLSAGTNRMVGVHAVKMAKKIAGEIHEKIGEELPDGEVEYLALYLQAEKYNDSTQAITDDAEKTVSGMLEYIHRKMGIDFSNDVDLRISLALHINPMLVRAQNNFQFKNQLLDEIVASYPLSYDIALTGASYLWENYGIRLNSDEVSYLAVYFTLSLHNQVELQDRKKVLIISSQRRGNSLMMKHMFLKKFSDRIEKLDFINISEIKTVNLDAYDVVFTTAVEFENLPSHITRINYFLGGQDCRVIAEKLDGDGTHRRFEDFFVRELLLCGGCYASKEELLREMTALAVKKYPNLDAEDLYESIMEREQSGLTCFGKGIAVPHPNKLVENEESFAVIAMPDQEIEWNAREKVSLIFLICIRSDDTKNLKQLFHGVSLLLSNEDIKAEIVKYRDYDDLYQYVKSLEYNE